MEGEIAGGKIEGSISDRTAGSVELKVTEHSKTGKL